jgi:hypothetical protein
VLGYISIDFGFGGKVFDVSAGVPPAKPLSPPSRVQQPPGLIRRRICALRPIIAATADHPIEVVPRASWSS